MGLNDLLEFLCFTLFFAALVLFVLTKIAKRYVEFHNEVRKEERYDRKTS
jgi:hypothetical protein